MTDERFFAVLLLLAVSVLVVGFVIGWSCREENDD